MNILERHYIISEWQHIISAANNISEWESYISKWQCIFRSSNTYFGAAIHISEKKFECNLTASLRINSTGV